MEGAEKRAVSSIYKNTSQSDSSFKARRFGWCFFSQNMRMIAHLIPCLMQNLHLRLDIKMQILHNIFELEVQS